MNIGPGFNIGFKIPFCKDRFPTSDISQKRELLCFNPKKVVHCNFPMWFIYPAHQIGRGGVKGFCKLADGIISDIERDFFGTKGAFDKTVFTGGYVELLPKKWLAGRRIEPNLANIGLAKAFEAAPDAAAVTKWYLLHAACVFVPVVFAMLVSFPDALGMVIPQLFPVVSLAVLLALEKK